MHAAITYLENQGHSMGFVNARKLGPSIGSGNVESTGKSLFALRMKRSGARWKTASAAEVITMCAHALSHRWQRANLLALMQPHVAIRSA